MRFVSLVLFVIFSSCAGNSGNETTTGDIHTITYFNSRGEKTSRDIYDREGNRVQYISFHGNGERMNSVRYTYDAQGRILEVKDSVDQILEVTEYDDEGRILLYRQTDPIDTVLTRHFYLEGGSLRVDSNYFTGRVDVNRLDGDGRVVSLLTVDASGDTVATGTREYDEEGRQVKTVDRDKDGWFRHAEYEFDAEGNQVKELYYEADGSLDKRYETEFDEMGRTVRISQYDAGDRETFRLEYSYKGPVKTCTQVLLGKPSDCGWEEYTYFD